MPERTFADEQVRLHELADQAIRLIGEFAARLDSLVGAWQGDHCGPAWSERVGRDEDGHLIEAWELPWEASGLQALVWYRFDDLRAAVDAAEMLVDRRREPALQ